MSSFWDSILKSSETVADTLVVSDSDFWSSIGLGVETKPKPVKQIKVKAVKKTAKQSKAVVEAEKVYETVEGLVVPAEDCKHHWIIASDTAWVIGVCQLCNGEKWFSNRYIENDSFNGTLVPPKAGQVEAGVAEQSIEDSLNSESYDADIRDITRVYNSNIEESA